MKMHHLLMIGAVVAGAALTAAGFVTGPLATLLLVGLLLLCPLMMLGMHRDGHDQARQGTDQDDADHAMDGAEQARGQRGPGEVGGHGR